MKKSFDYHDPRAKNIIVKAMTESHMIHHYRKIQNVIPYVDTNIRKKPTIQSYVVRCQCGNRIHTNSSYSRRNFRQNEYKKTVESGVPCSRFNRCFNEDKNLPTLKSCSKIGESKLKSLTDVYHPPRTRPPTTHKNEEECCHSESHSGGYMCNLEESREHSPDYIDLMKKITDDILNNSLYTSSEIRKLFREHIRSNDNMTEEEIQSEFQDLEEELRFTSDTMFPSSIFDRRHKGTFKTPGSYASFKLDDLNISPETLESIKEALNIPKTEDCFSQTNQDSALSVKSNDDLDDNPNDRILNFSHDPMEEDMSLDHKDGSECAKEENELIDEFHHSNDEKSAKDDDLESLDDFSSIHSFRD